jgi:hypothetical protein
MSTRASRTSDLGKRFSGLVLLAESYVNVEWDEFGDPESAVRAFRDDFPQQARSAADGIAALLQEYPSEEERYAALDELGWGYWGPPGALDKFLSWAREQLLESAN